MFILNQDHNEMYWYDNNSCLYTMPVFHQKKLMGFNLYVDGDFLGTFDSVKECVKEITNIVNCECEYYCVLGYSDWNIIEHLMIEQSKSRP